MTTIPPQPPPPPPLPANALRQLPVVTVADPQSALTKLAAGTTFDGTVVSKAGKTAVQVQTVYGSIQIQTTLPLDKGARLTLVLQSLTQPLQLQLAAIDGKPTVPLAAPPSQMAASAQGSAIPAAAPGTAPSPSATGNGPFAALRGLVGTSLTATLLRPATLSTPLSYGPRQVVPPNPSSAPGPAAPSVPSGPPAPSGLPTPPGPPASPSPLSPGTTVSAAGGFPSPSPVLSGPSHGPSGAPLPGLLTIAAGAQLTVRIVAVTPQPGDTATVPGSTPRATAQPVVGQTITAVVTSATTAGQTILRTPIGTVALATPTPLPRGAEVVLEVRSEPLLAEPATGAPPPPRPFTLVQARAWPALVEAYKALQSLNPAAAQTLEATHLPQANSRLTADMLFFLSALRGGDLGGWLSDAPVKILRRDRPDLLSRLGEEFRQIGTMAHKPVTGDWRVALVPFFTGNEIEQIRLYLRPHGGDDGNSDGAPQGVRFIIDVNLTRLGRLQLDGLVRDNRKRVDLIVRTDAPLPGSMQEDIRAIFTEANALTGIAGGLSFQAAPAHFVDIGLADESADGPGLIA